MVKQLQVVTGHVRQQFAIERTLHCHDVRLTELESPATVIAASKPIGRMLRLFRDSHTTTWEGYRMKPLTLQISVTLDEKAVNDFIRKIARHLAVDDLNRRSGTSTSELESASVSASGQASVGGQKTSGATQRRFGQALAGQDPDIGWYSPEQLAEILNKRPYTVREWCRLGRVNARKRPVGRGDAREWEISHEELVRIRNHGLLPIPSKY